MRSRYSDNVWNEVVRLYFDDYGERQIASMLDIPASTVHYMIDKKVDKSDRHEAGGTLKYPTYIYDKIVELYNQGFGHVNISKKLDIPFSTVVYTIRRLIRNRRNFDDARVLKSKIMLKNSTYFDFIDCHEKAYWLGFLFADGWLRGEKGRKAIGFSLKYEDAYMVKNFARLFDRVRDVKIIEQYLKVTNKYYKRAYFEISSLYLFNSLVDKGLYPRKTFSTEMKLFKTMERSEFLNSFILGFFDGDGSIGAAQRGDVRISFCGLREVLCWLKNILMHKFDLNDNKIYDAKSISALAWSGKQIKAPMNWLYKDSPIRLGRKYKIYQDYLRGLR